MKLAEFKRTRALFDEALQRPAPRRQAFLERACGTDTELLLRVTRLLDHADGEPSAGPGAIREPAVGTPAPDFDLPCVSGNAVLDRTALSDFRGRWLVLIFYPHDFSLICPTELTAMSARINDFHDAGAEIIGVSVDSPDTHERWLATPRARGGLGGLDFALASDEDGGVSRAYGVYLETQHVALRGIFIIDPNGVLQYKAVHNLSVGRRTDDILRVLSALQTGGLCPEDWTAGVATIDPIQALTVGSVVSHYRIEECIGSGGFASVFRAHDMTLERTVAIKVINPDSRLSASAILDEARAAAALNHTNICTVFAVDDSEGIPLIAMEYVSGPPLSEMLAQEPLPPSQAADIACQIASGMEAAHAMGISHGDLKPANVVVRDDGVVKILDFGLARLKGPSAGAESATGCDPCRTRGLRGTPAYMSPEQADGGRATPESDVFSLGLILYELLAGKPAFAGPEIPDFLEQIRAVDGERLAADVPRPYADVVARALVHDRGERTVTMREMAGELARAPASSPE